MKTKNLKKIILGILALGLIGLTSCEKMEVVKVIGFIQGHVFNGNTNEVLDSVKVEYMVAGSKNVVYLFIIKLRIVPKLHKLRKTDN